MIDAEILTRAITNKNNTIFDLSNERPVLMVFLRHFGCIYCRESLADLSSITKKIEDRNFHLVLVHMSGFELANEYLGKYNLENMEQISDPSCSLYADFGLVKGSMGQLFGLKVWARGFSQLAKGNVFSTKQIGDGFQMPGIFVISKGVIKNLFVHNSVADRPDYLELMDNVRET